MRRVQIAESLEYGGLMFVYKLIADSTAEGVANGSGPREHKVTAGATPAAVR